ncbi:DUF3224 domain-containing protein [Amycolatopsis regifaucium]|uniref:DUF3224 domain-containing protein n=1 Tax=Amycolatopsis regifaucium TaxID=546365 RepID=A0A154MCU8_9PSEU|nr:DUF3224 domain-containing protein [Amycolatopsis regifaucium]KZB82418.1 hypothetical protein AVL48_10955 [Amycolatopsis regifaucium]OKA10184.1 hypothetical protein ATP06_0204595 [Amycolatopsis regifaucium]SFG92302.1 Protein of unknown function [Amycolatopsis regifaucium]
MNTFAMKNWEENIVSGTDGGPRVAYAHATLAYRGLIEGESIVDYLLYYAGEGYDGDGTTAPGFERVEGSVDGRKGSFVIKHDTGFDAKGISSTFTVVEGSGTGELAGITGTGTTAGVLGEPTMSYTFDYSL